MNAHFLIEKDHLLNAGRNILLVIFMSQSREWAESHA